MIRRCTLEDLAAIEEVVNDGALAYRGVIPTDCWHEPYMSRAELLGESAAGVSFLGWEEHRRLVGVMGEQRVLDVTLIRHAYVRTSHQRHGIGAALLERLIAEIVTPLFVGTWADATWAIRFYKRHGFHLLAESHKDQLLQTYWRIPDRQRATSVVLERRP